MVNSIISYGCIFSDMIFTIGNNEFIYLGFGSILDLKIIQNFSSLILKKMQQKFLLFLAIFIFTFSNTLASWDIYNMYSLPNWSINTSTWYTLAFSHIDWSFYVNDKFLDILLVKFVLTLLWLIFFTTLSLKMFNLWKK